ncbi:hypothetical protein BVY04_03830 [bacterium M21]|nr:hypothetical protein BVY04_03830 [bacterium M21]
MSSPTLGIVCSVLQREVAYLEQQQSFSIEFMYLDSMLHMYPDKLETRQDQLVREQLALGKRVLLVYGDCHPTIIQLGQQANVVRTKGVNCCELLLGKEEFRRYLKLGAFFLIPEWAVRWRTVFGKELGLNREVARAMMGDLHTRLLYLDTGLVEVPRKELDEMSDYCGLPWESVQIDLSVLRQKIEAALEEF